MPSLTRPSIAADDRLGQVKGYEFDLLIVCGHSFDRFT